MGLPAHEVRDAQRDALAFLAGVLDDDDEAVRVIRENCDHTAVAMCLFALHLGGLQAAGISAGQVCDSLALNVVTAWESHGADPREEVAGLLALTKEHS